MKTVGRDRKCTEDSRLEQNHTSDYIKGKWTRHPDQQSDRTEELILSSVYCLPGMPVKRGCTYYPTETRNEAQPGCGSLCGAGRELGLIKHANEMLTQAALN